MLKCIIVDDERVILNEIKELVSRANVQVVGIYQNSLLALEEIESTFPDVAFIDIEMPELNGIELANRIKDINYNIQIVFITAYKEYALNAFGVNAIHYLLKPISMDDIKEAINRAHKIKQMKQGLDVAKSASIIKSKQGLPKKISLRNNEDIVVINITDILYLASANGVTTIYTKEGGYKTRNGLNYWDNSLKGFDFIRCHKSYIVNANYIFKMIHVLGEYKELLLSYCEIRIPISRRKVNVIKAWMGLV